jgi:hypothetical protein
MDHMERISKAIFVLNIGFVAIVGEGTSCSRPSDYGSIMHENTPLAVTSTKNITSSIEARKIALTYLHDRVLNRRLSAGQASKSGGWIFLVEPLQGEYPAGGHFFLHVNMDGTIVYLPGA